MKDFWDYVKTQKKWWIAPILIIMLLFGFVVIFASSSVVSPFIYTLF